MQRWQKHFLFWTGVYFIWMYMKTFGDVELHNVLVNLVHLMSYIALYYVVREFLIPRFFDNRQWWRFGLGLVLWTVVVVFVWNALMQALDVYYELPIHTIPDNYIGYVLETVQMFVPGMILLAWESFDDAAMEEDRLHLLEKEKISTELNYLKAKVNPQFIFNTLKNLKTFVDEKSTKAPDMILRLSEVLDYVLYRSQQDLVKLNDEVEVIKGFIALEQLRLGDRLDIEMKTEGDMMVDICPLTLLAIIENALKENIISQSDHLDVRILIKSEGNNVTCEINVKNDDQTTLENNGLTEIKRQLTLTYPDRHQLLQREVNASILTTLTLTAAS